MTRTLLLWQTELRTAAHAMDDFKRTGDAAQLREVERCCVRLSNKLRRHRKRLGKRAKETG